MSTEVLKFLVMFLGCLYVATMMMLYLFYMMKWKKFIRSRQSELELAEKQALSGQIAEEHARNLVKNMRRTIDTYEKAIFKEDEKEPVEK